jgi:choline dehydrogenase-like flavoprotein
MSGVTDTDTSKALVTPLAHVSANPPHVVIVGSGPAGVAVAEYLYNVFPQASVAILERGDILTLTHIGNVSSDTDPRGPFIAAHGDHPWEGDFKEHGMMMFALGGRGIVAGGHLRRFDNVDYTLWPEGQWPIKPPELAPFFTVAEIVRHVSTGECQSPAQTWVMGELDAFNPHPPPWGVDVRSTGSRRGLDSSVERLYELIQRDCVEAHQKKGKRRLFVSTNALVTKLKVENDRVTGIECAVPRHDQVVEIKGEIVILAASPIESARLVLGSDLGRSEGVGGVAGRYLAEHLLCTAEIPVPFSSLAGGRVSVVVPPSGPQVLERFQIDVKTATFTGGGGGNSLRIFGFAAMDPHRDNRAVLRGDVVNTDLKLRGDYDGDRVNAMRARIREIARKLGARSGVGITGPILGRSNHEVGTLRMGHAGSESVTTPSGQVRGVENLFVADASVFPCVGVANPMLTTTALAYRLAHYVGLKLGHEPKSIEPWSICGESSGGSSRAASADLNP